MRYFSSLTYSMVLLLAASSTGLALPSEATTGDREVLVRQYFVLTHHEERAREDYIRQIKLALGFCAGRPCQPDLDKAIGAAVNEAIPRQEQTSMALLAHRLRAEDLCAAITFARSPAGQAIVSAENAMDDQIAAIGHATTITTYAGVSLRFFPSHRDVCVAHGLLKTSAMALSK